MSEITDEMKAECMGEFSFAVEMECTACGFDEPDEDCEVCQGGVQYERKIDVPWTTCKEIYSRMAKVAERGSITEKPDNSDHIPDATKMIQGDVQCMGNLYFNDEDNYENALVIAFADRAGLKAALDSKQCRFTVFGGEV